VIAIFKTYYRRFLKEFEISDMIDLGQSDPQAIIRSDNFLDAPRVDCGQVFIHEPGWFSSHFWVVCEQNFKRLISSSAALYSLFVEILEWQNLINFLMKRRLELPGSLNDLGDIEVGRAGLLRFGHIN